MAISIAKRIFSALAVTIACAPAVAGPLEDGKAALDRKDYPAALALLQPLADQGQPSAQCEVGMVYKASVEWQSRRAAMAPWFQKAADQGNAEAQAQLGYIHLADGENGSHYVDHVWIESPEEKAAGSFTQSLAWFRKAADQGHANARWRLGMAYWQGLGVPKDMIKAYMWTSLAVASGRKSYENVLVDIAKDMTPDEIAEGRRLATHWQSSHAAPYEKQDC